MIVLSAGINDVRRQEKRLIDKGIKKGAFELALKVKREFGLEEAIEISGFSRTELENEKLDL